MDNGTMDPPDYLPDCDQKSCRERDFPAELLIPVISKSSELKDLLRGDSRQLRWPSGIERLSLEL